MESRCYSAGHVFRYTVAEKSVHSGEVAEAVLFWPFAQCQPSNLDRGRVTGTSTCIPPLRLSPSHQTSSDQPQACCSLLQGLTLLCQHRHNWMRWGKRPRGHTGTKHGETADSAGCAMRVRVRATVQPTSWSRSASSSVIEKCKPVQAHGWTRKLKSYCLVQYSAK